MKPIGPCLAALLALGCGGSESPAGADAAPSGLATTCTGTCQAVTASATFGANTRAFERAHFGLSSPANSESGDWEIYVEASRGGDGQCPSEDAPTPDVLLVMSGLAIPSAITTVPATTTLVDFEGVLIPDQPFERADSGAATWVAADPCVACAEGSEADRASRMVAFDIEASFPSGTAGGRVYATHCDSLDAL